MLGTLNGALEVRGVSLSGDDISAEVEGFNVLENRLPVLRRIEIRYRLRIPTDSRELVERALGRHQEKCPTAATLKGAVEVSWSADLEEAAD